MQVGKRIVGLGFMLLSAACSDMEPSGGRDDNTQSGVIDHDNPSSNAVQNSGEAAASASLAAFTDTLHPLLKERCGACHGQAQSPKFAVAAPDQAFKVITEAQLTNPSAVPASRLVTRLGQLSHNCWSECEADAKTMEDAIRAWYAAAGEASGQSDAIALVKLGAVPVSGAKEFVLKGGHNKNWLVAASAPDALGERLALKEDLTSSQRQILARRDDLATLNPQPQGGAYYFFEIPETSTDKYQLWFRGKNVGLGERVTFQINGQDYTAAAPYRQADQTAIDQRYIWFTAFVDGQGTAATTGARELKQMPMLKKMMLYVRDTEPSVDMIGLTANATFDQTLTVNAGRRTGYTFDLTGLLGKKAVLSLQYSKTPDGKAYIFSRPTIETAEPMKIQAKTMYVLLNGELNKQLSTFASMDVTTDGSAELSRSDMLVPIVDETKDTIEIGFEKLVLVP